MGEIVNLRRVRKARVQAEAAQQAETNRARKGQTKAERNATKQERASIDRTLDGAKVDKPTEQ